MKPDDHRAAEAWLRERRHDIAPLARRQRLIAALLGVLVVLQAWVLARIIDQAAFAGAGLNALAPLLVAWVPLLLLRGGLAWTGDRLAWRAAQQVRSQLRRELFDHLRRSGPYPLRERPTGELGNVLVDAVEAIGPYFAHYLPARLLMTLVPPLILLAVWPADWLSGLILLLTAPLVPLFMALIGQAAQRASQRQWRQLSRMGGHFLDVLRHLPLLKAFNASRRETARIAQTAEAFRRRTMQVLRLAFLSSAVLEFLAAISIALVAVLVGFRLLDGEMAFFHGLFVLLLAPEFYLPLRRYGAQNHARMEAIAAAEQILEVLALPAAAPAATSSQVALRHGALELRDLHFTHPGGDTALAGLDLRIEPGEHLAIVGPSGAGKSTLLLLLLGFIPPESGEIRLAGAPLEAAHLAAWRRRIGWVPQRPHLFPGTLRENIALGCPDAPTETVREAAQAAGILDFIEALPEGFETPIGEGGRGLSGGQRQRIALARALLHRPDWLLLDEPTAHLDPDSERAFVAALRNLRGRVGIVHVAHRLETLHEADRIVVMQGGRVTDSGDWQTLCSRPGPFRDLLEAPA